MYKINKSHKYINQLAVIAEEFGKMSELNNVIGWYLQARPRIYGLEIEHDYFVWETIQFPSDFPLLRIFYKEDDSARTVTLLSIKRAPLVSTNLQ